jgi:hypothetical protein
VAVANVKGSPPRRVNPTTAQTIRPRIATGIRTLTKPNPTVFSSLAWL